MQSGKKDTNRAVEEAKYILIAVEPPALLSQAIEEAEAAATPEEIQDLEERVLRQGDHHDTERDIFGDSLPLHAQGELGCTFLPLNMSLDLNAAAGGRARGASDELQGVSDEASPSSREKSRKKSTKTSKKTSTPSSTTQEVPNPGPALVLPAVVTYGCNAIENFCSEPLPPADTPEYLARLVPVERTCPATVKARSPEPRGGFIFISPLSPP